MIKLFKILSEIKIVGNITPEIVYQNWKKVENIIFNFLNNEEREKLRIIRKILDNVIENFWFLPGEDIKFIIDTSNKEDLKKIYKACNFIINKY